MVAAALVPLFVTSDYHMSVLVLILLYATLSQSLDLVLGRLRLPSIAHAALFMTGAYTLAILTTAHQWPYWAGWVAGIIVTGIVGLALAVVTMPTRGHFFAISSLCFCGAVVVILTQWTSVTQGDLGIYGIPSPPNLSLFGVTFDFETLGGKYYLALILLLVVVGIIARIRTSAYGRSLEVIRDDDVLAAALGVNVTAEKVKTFCLSSAIAGAAGGLYASYASYINPADAGILPSFNVCIYVILGGAATLTGPIVGPLLVVGLAEVLRFTDLWSNLVFGVVLVIVLLFFPRGISGSIAVYWKRLRTENEILDGVAPPTPQSQGPPPAAETIPRSERLLPPRQARHAAHSRDEESGTEPAPVLQVIDASKRFGGVRAVAGVSLVTYPSEIVGVIGPNGAGKSTLFGLIAGTVARNGGRIIFEGRDITKEPPHKRVRRGIGRTFQTNRILAGRTVMENLLIASHVHFSTNLVESLVQPPGTRRKVRRHIGWLRDVIGVLGLTGMEDTPVESLTVEEQKVLGIAMALASEPRVLILDEPFAGLRETETERLQRLLVDLRRDGMSILLVEHKMKVIMSLCDRCYVLDQGELISQGTPDEVAADDAVVAAYLGG
ncbi:branched-chain amino acid ABC transporter ATP-binding protein/permease [Actinomadura macra]|uniref:branched-chain amino acid ABC transporter ATP-binding protein/permease n=1 Tax=Actinomadura macra TaxID=46164 RepID=UPI00082C694A|nr:branched-chain amino acid ABC transporter ATP-binding protein/permease [Actinomadura macra]